MAVNVTVRQVKRLTDSFVKLAWYINLFFVIVICRPVSSSMNLKHIVSRRVLWISQLYDSRKATYLAVVTFIAQCRHNHNIWTGFYIIWLNSSLGMSDLLYSFIYSLQYGLVYSSSVRIFDEKRWYISFCKNHKVFQSFRDSREIINVRFLFPFVIYQWLDNFTNNGTMIVTIVHIILFFQLYMLLVIIFPTFCG